MKVRPFSRGEEMITLVLNSPDIDEELLRKLSRSSMLIGVDGGLNRIIAAGLEPDWAVGDFDSVDPSLLASLPQKTKVLRAPVEKDFTDLELALQVARKYRPRRLNVLGLGGGRRFDHQLVNSLLLSSFVQGVCVQAWSGRQKLTFTGTSHVLFRADGEMFSVFALEKPISVSLRGAKYSGTGLKLLPGSGLGLGNKIVKSRVFVGIRGGTAVICQWSDL